MSMDIIGKIRAYAPFNEQEARDRDELLRRRRSAV